jgi:hypothetical protein
LLERVKKGQLAASVFAVAVIVTILALITSSGGPSPSSGTKAGHAHTLVAAHQKAPSRGAKLKAAAASALPDVDPAAGGQDIPSVSIAEAQKTLPFDMLVPDAAQAEAQDRTGIYVVGDSVEMAYPPPDDTSGDLRQPYITVWEAPWTEGDPKAAFAESIDQYPDVGKSLCDVNGLPALCVEPRSPSDAQKSNPAYLSVVVDKVEVDVSGGDSLKALLSIASSLTAQQNPQSAGG